MKNRTNRKRFATTTTPAEGVVCKKTATKRGFDFTRLANSCISSPTFENAKDELALRVNVPLNAAAHELSNDNKTRGADAQIEYEIKMLSREVEESNEQSEIEENFSSAGKIDKNNCFINNHSSIRAGGKSEDLTTANCTNGFAPTAGAADHFINRLMLELLAAASANNDSAIEGQTNDRRNNEANNPKFSLREDPFKPPDLINSVQYRNEQFW